MAETETQARHNRPVARTWHTRWFGLVWAVPLAALIIVTFLGVRALAERGVDIVVTFGTAGGAKVNDTKVIYKGLEAGYVRKIQISDDGMHVDMTLRMNPRSKPALTTQTKFWLIGANPTITDLASVKAAVAGLTIGMAPSVGGVPTRRFTGLDEPPLFPPGTLGTTYTLMADALGNARVGSSIFFRGQQIGKVTIKNFAPPNRFRLSVFVQAPYDKLVQPAALFWISRPVQVELTDKGLSAAIEHAGSLIEGAIEFDTPNQPEAGAQSPPGTEFPLFQSHRDAETGLTGPAVPYSFVFNGPAGELAANAQVRLLGFQVGEVTSVRLQLDAQTGEPSSLVQANLFPRKLHLFPLKDANDAASWRKLTDATINRLLAHGYRARIIQSPPLIGTRLISLEMAPGAGKAVFVSSEQQRIPSDSAAGGRNIDELMGQINHILTKVDRIPIEAIAENVRQVSERLSILVSSPEIGDSLKHFDNTMTQADNMMREVTPRVGPLIGKLNQAADELTGTVAAARTLLGGPDANGGGSSGGTTNLPQTIDQLNEAARSIRTLADYLTRHPESLVRGRGSESASRPNEDKQ